MAKMIVDDYEVLQGFRDKLGRGASGDVFKGKHLPSGDLVAVKIVELNEKTEDGREYARKYIMTEVELLRTLRHDNIVQLFHSKKQNGFLFIFLELCDKGDLADFVLEKGSLSAKMTVSFLRDISRALACLHRHDPVIVHRDVKPENMLVVAKSLDETECSIKLTDFAFSRRAPPGSAAFSATFVGTVQWMAPEIRPGSDGHVRYDEKADVFSSGLVFLSLIEHVSGTSLRASIVDGLSLGEWITQHQLRGEKVSTPNITKASDNALQTLVKGIILQMINPDPSARCCMQQVCGTIDLAYASAASDPSRTDDAEGAGAEGASARGARAEGAIATGARAEGAIARGARAEGAIARGARATRGAGGGSLTARLAAVSLKSASAELRVRKLNYITLTSRHPGVLFFGLANFLVGYKNDPDFYYYAYSSKFELVWQKKMPDGFLFDNYKHLHGNNNIYIQHYADYFCQFNRSLDLVAKHSSPGYMICILPGGQDAVVCNKVSPSTNTEGVRLSRAPVHNLHAPHYHLDSPDAGPYSREEVLYACGRQDGRVAVISLEKPFVDIYSETGRYVCRTRLPHKAGNPGCSDTHVLISLWEKPSICVLSWQGELIHILGSDQLGLHEHDLGGFVSPVHEGRFSFGTSSPASIHQVHTYQIQ